MEIANFFTTDLSREIVVKALNEQPHTPLWHACKNGYLNMVREIMTLDPSLLSKNAPDKTSPELMALIKDHKDILTYLEKDWELKVSFSETSCPFSQELSFMANLTKKFPVFNDEVESKLEHELIRDIAIRDMELHILGPSCPLRSEIKKPTNIIIINQVNLDKCTGGVR